MIQNWKFQRGDIFFTRFDNAIGSEQSGNRPAVVLQNDVGNKHSPTVICAAITSRMNKAKLPTHIEIDAASYAIIKDSVILLEQLRSISIYRYSHLLQPVPEDEDGYESGFCRENSSLA